MIQAEKVINLLQLLFPIDLSNLFLYQQELSPKLARFNSKTAQINSSNGKIQFLHQHKSRRTAHTVAIRFLINQGSKTINDLWWSSHVITLLSHENFHSPPTFPFKWIWCLYIFLKFICSNEIKCIIIYSSNVYMISIWCQFDVHQIFIWYVHLFFWPLPFHLIPSVHVMFILFIGCSSVIYLIGLCILLIFIFSFEYLSAHVMFI